MYSTNIDIQQ